MVTEEVDGDTALVEDPARELPAEEAADDDAGLLLGGRVEDGATLVPGLEVPLLTLVPALLLGALDEVPTAPLEEEEASVPLVPEQWHHMPANRNTVKMRARNVDPLVGGSSSST